MDMRSHHRSSPPAPIPTPAMTASASASSPSRRDEYFAHIGWPKGSHIIEIDRFLRAMVRDIGWGFFYGWIFFDDIFGTTNHYGTVDIFAGSYDQGYKDQGTDHLETFSAEVVKEAFETISRNWINEGYDPLERPARNRLAARPEDEGTHRRAGARLPPAKRMLGLDGDAPVRSDATGHPINRAFADMEFDTPDIECEPGFEGQLHAINLFDHIARADVTRNPSFTAITGASICCVTSEEHMLPVIHGNDRNEWFIQLTDEIHWQIADKNTGAPRGRIVMKSGDVCAMPADIRHQRLFAQALDADGAGERHAGAGDSATPRASCKPYPVDFG